MPADQVTRINALDACLPQLQCGQCGFGGCRPYATAMVEEAALPNRCPPGGKDVLAALQATGSWSALSDDAGFDEIAADCGPAPSAGLAWIDEQWCIGCTKCIAICPVDAIVGANKKMHTVLQAVCTGCDLCLPVCPVDCIVMQPRVSTMNAQQQTVSGQRAQARRSRVLATPAKELSVPDSDQQAMIFAAALARAKART
jgi:Na+-translocating ferredoxin:NAD+ oxidoreductase subunit B